MQWHGKFSVYYDVHTKYFVKTIHVYIDIHGGKGYENIYLQSEQRLFLNGDFSEPSKNFKMYYFYI